MSSILIPRRPRRARLPSSTSTSTSNEWNSTTSITSTTLLPSLMSDTTSSNDKPSPFTLSNIIATPRRATSSPDASSSDASTSLRRRQQFEPSSPISPHLSSSSTPTLQLLTPPSTPSITSRPTLTSPERWTPDFSLNLLFTADGTTEEIPPSFYPSARIFFSPQLKVQSSNGIPYSSLGGMHLGVTGTMELLDGTGKVKGKRVIADFTTDIGAGIAIWKRDAEKARIQAGLLREEAEEEEKVLPPGTYVLPLSLRIPRSEKLPPSFECSHFRIRYTMSLALFSSTTTSNGNPHRLKVYSVPFHVLPSTLPSLAPEVPILTHTHRKGVFASLFQSLSSTPKTEGYHIVVPSIPTSSYSPGSFSTIPVSIRIVDRPLEPTDLYIRIALIRRIYVRESSSSSSSLAVAIENDFGINGISTSLLGLPEEVLMERWCKEETELVSRWGYIPYSTRPGADPMEKAEVIIQDLALPLSGLNDAGWNSGYTTSLDLEPTVLPDQSHGECSWFSPAFRNRPPIAKEYSKHVHISSKFFLSIEIGFANSTLSETLQAIKITSPDIDIPAPASFTVPQTPSTSRFSGASLSNPFLPLANSTRSHRPSPTSPTSPTHSSTTSPFNPAPAFPGKFREIFIPIEIGSVAEPSLDCVSRADESSTSRADREGREDRGEDTRADGEGPLGAYIVAPPNYETAISRAPAYLFTV